MLKEFTYYRKLRPLNIILNCKNTEARNYFATRLARAYNIPIVNYTSIVKILSIDEEDLDEEEFDMYKPFMAIKMKLETETDERKRNEIMYDALKEILRENVCRNRGYVLTGIPISEEEINLLYWSNDSLNLARTQKPLEEGDEGYEPPEENNEEEIEEPDEIVKDEKANMEGNNMEGNMEGENELKMTESVIINENENMENIEGMENNMENQDNPPFIAPKKKKKPPKPIKYKTIVTHNKDLIPESVITIRRSIMILN